VITHVIVSDETVFLLSIYDKAEKSDLLKNELEELLGLIPDDGE